MLTDEQIRANRDRRPLYAIGERLRVTEVGRFQDWQGEVLRITPWQNSAGFIVTYMYRLRMENLAQQEWPEESLARVESEPGGETEE